ncbi:MAG: hypothetical protein RLO50_18465 [Azospirillaceae bacterium]
MRVLVLAVASLALCACATIDWRETGQRFVESACRGAGNCDVACTAEGLSPTGSSRCQPEPQALPAGR